MSGSPRAVTFYGFFPREKKAQKPLLETLKKKDHLVLFYESPNRVRATLETLRDALGDLDAALLRELTKLHEETVCGTLGELAARYADAAPRGECVLAVYCRAQADANAVPALEETLESLLSRGLSVRDAAAEAALVCGVPKKEAYAKALEINKNCFS
jgi:16S rRNA (cytidine1402-2'-O)-methyltransferase